MIFISTENEINEQSDPSAPSDWKQRQEMYQGAREHLLALRQESFNSADQLIVTISSAFLGLSATFLKDLAPLGRATCLPLVMCSWALFTIAILAVFFSFVLSRKSMDVEDVRLERYYLKYEDDAFTEVNKCARSTEICNGVATACFVGAVVFFGLFAITNAIAEQNYQRILIEQKQAKVQANGKHNKLKGN